MPFSTAGAWVGISPWTGICFCTDELTLYLQFSYYLVEKQLIVCTAAGLPVLSFASWAPLCYPVSKLTAVN